MMVIVSLRRLQDSMIEVCVARAQHKSRYVQTYSSEKEAEGVLRDFGFEKDATQLYLFKLLPSLSPTQELKFPPKNIPQQDLLLRGFNMQFGNDMRFQAFDELFARIKLRLEEKGPPTLRLRHGMAESEQSTQPAPLNIALWRNNP